MAFFSLLSHALCSDWILKQTLKSSIQEPNLFGRSVAFSSSNHRVVIAAEKETVNGDAGRGAIYVYDFSSSAGAWNLNAKLTAKDPSVLKIYGLGSSIQISSDGNRIFAGAPYTTDKGNPNSGSVVIFDYNGSSWAQSGILRPDTPNDELGFGRSMAIIANGTEIVVGATNSVSLTTISLPGCAFAFKQTGSSWAQTQRIDYKGTVSLSGSRFATAIQIHDDNDMMITTSAINGAAIGPSVYWKANGQWISDSQIPAISSYKGVTFANFGGHSSMPPSSSHIATLVGSANKSLQYSNGVAFVMEKSNGVWSTSPSATVLPPSTTASFGGAVMCSESRIIFTDQSNSEKGTSVGAIHVYEKSNGGYSLSETIYPPDNSEYLSFGSGVAIAEDCTTIIVGAFAMKSNGTSFEAKGSAKAYIYILSETAGLSGVTTKIVLWTSVAFAAAVGTICLAAFIYSKKSRGFEPISAN